MNLFLWEHVEHLTDNWHSSGGLVIVAETLDEARFLLQRTAGVDVECDAYSKDPSVVYVVTADAEPEVYSFPDAGCC